MRTGVKSLLRPCRRSRRLCRGSIDGVSSVFRAQCAAFRVSGFTDEVDALASSPSARLLDSSLGNVLVQKRAAEQALRESGLDWAIVRPGLLQQERVAGGIVPPAPARNDVCGRIEGRNEGCKERLDFPAVVKTT